MIETRTDTQYAAVTSAYGTGAENCSASEVAQHLYIPGMEMEELGLHKPTVFKLDLGNRKRLAWGPKHFVTRGYVAKQGLVAGSLNDRQQKKALDYFDKHGLQFPLP